MRAPSNIYLHIVFYAHVFICAYVVVSYMSDYVHMWFSKRKIHPYVLDSKQSHICISSTHVVVVFNNKRI